MLKNPFTPETVELFIEARNCWYCGFRKNKAGHNVDAIHHILGRQSNSPFNAAPIHNQICHLDNGKLSTDEVRRALLLRTYTFLLSSGYEPTPKDYRFVEKNIKYYPPNTIIYVD